jgi:CRISPR-associated protein Csm5
MNQFNCYRIFLTPLSPVHIGTGDSYEPTNYVIENGELYEFDTGTAMSALSQDDRAELARITDGRPGAGMIQSMHRFFYERRSRLLPAAVNRILVSDGVAQLYTGRIGKAAQREPSGREDLNKLGISRTAYNPISRRPTLMGSSLKGAIRTALLDQVNNGRPTTEREGLHKFQGNRDLFRYSQNRLELQRDPMRLVQLSDATWQGDTKSATAEVFFAANLKKIPVADQQGQRRSTRADSGPPQILECIPHFRYRAFAAQLNIQLLDGIDQPGSLPDADLRFDMRRIASACNAFYQPILAQEMQFLSTAGYLESAWRDCVTKVLEDSHLKNGDAFLLRVGRHSGAESVTLRGVRKIRIMKGRGQSAQEATSATTVWLAARQRGQMTGLMPFGWTLAEFCPLEQRAADENISLKTLCTESEGALRARLQPPPKRQVPQQSTGAKSSSPGTRTIRPPETKASGQRPSSPSQETTFTTTEVVWEKTTITWNAGGGGIITAIAPDQKRAEARGKAAQDFLATLTEQQRKQLLDRKKDLFNVRVVVEITGNRRTLKRHEPERG